MRRARLGARDLVEPGDDATAVDGGCDDCLAGVSELRRDSVPSTLALQVPHKAGKQAPPSAGKVVVQAGNLPCVRTAVTTCWMAALTALGDSSWM